MKSSTSKPTWMLAADVVLDFVAPAGQQCSLTPAPTPTSGWYGLPAHKKAVVPRRKPIITRAQDDTSFSINQIRDPLSRKRITLAPSLLDPLALAKISNCGSKGFTIDS
jgi:hypothetical protein